MVKQQSTSLAVSKVRNRAGELVYAMDEIIKCFHEYYVSMYRTRLTCTDREMEQYMNEIEYPKLTEEQVSMMDKEITEEEVWHAVRLLASGKSADGIRLEVYNQYIVILAPILTRMYTEAFK